MSDIFFANMGILGIIILALIFTSAYFINKKQ